MSETKIYTIDVDKSDSTVEMMNSVPQTQMRLLSYRFKMDFLGIAEPNRTDVVYMDIGTVIGSTYFIDNNIGSYRFPLALDNSLVDPGTGYSITFVSGISVPLTMSGALDHSVDVRVFNKAGQIISNDVLKHCFLQFEYD